MRKARLCRQETRTQQDENRFHVQGHQKGKSALQCCWTVSREEEEEEEEERNYGCYKQQESNFGSRSWSRSDRPATDPENRSEFPGIRRNMRQIEPRGRRRRRRRRYTPALLCCLLFAVCCCFFLSCNLCK